MSAPRIHTSEFPPVEMPDDADLADRAGRRRRARATTPRWSTASPARRSPTRSWRTWSSGWPPGFAEIGVQPGRRRRAAQPEHRALPGRLLRGEPRRAPRSPRCRRWPRPRTWPTSSPTPAPPWSSPSARCCRSRSRRPATGRCGPATGSRATAACRTCWPRPAPVPEVASTPPRTSPCCPTPRGTTGLPKGVMLTHASIGVNLRQIAALRPMTPDDRIIAVLPFFHIYGMTALMNLPLQAGATVVVLPRFDLEQFLDGARASSGSPRSSWPRRSSWRWPSTRPSPGTTCRRCRLDRLRRRAAGRRARRRRPPSAAGRARSPRPTG